MYRITRRLEVYLRNGNGWNKTPNGIKYFDITKEEYDRFVESIPFFRSFGSYGNGSYCRKYCGYTYIGYLPIKVITVAPGREIKHVDTFTVDLIPDCE